jgi:hypothetical protein
MRPYKGARLTNKSATHLQAATCMGYARYSQSEGTFEIEHLILTYVDTALDLLHTQLNFV